MSSFLQKNHLTENGVLEKKEKLFPCPECGNITMQLVQVDCTLNDGTYIPNLEYYFCSSCQSKFYHDAAMEKIETVRQRSANGFHIPTLSSKPKHTKVMND